MQYQDQDLGVHKQNVRCLLWPSSILGIVGVNLGAGAGVSSRILYAPGFRHFAGVIVATTPVATTLSVRVEPITTTVTVTTQEYVVATIATAALAGAQRFPFYWGSARGLLLDAAGLGTNFCFTRQFRIWIRNAGGAAANPLDLGRLEAV